MLSTAIDVGLFVFYFRLHILC